MKAKILLAVAWGLVTLPLWGTDRHEAQMLATATQVLDASRPVQHVADYPHMAVYAQAGGGFAMVSTDVNDPRLLAYSRQGTFDATTDNPGFNWWCRAIGRAQLRTTTKPDTTRFAAAVEPLTTSRWGQNEPCRYMCPFLEYEPDLSKYGVYLPDSTHNAVGCGPAAMAQIMYYYKYPKQGTGEASVVVKYDQANVTLNVNLGETTYDWDNMLDDYSGEYTDQQGEAVATLCYHAAVAAKANWNRLGGATFDDDILKAMIENFGYNDSAQVLPRPLYDESQWMEMVYGMLTQRQPILYSGKDINFEVGILVGHNFIIDGYDENGLVHVNWGWHGQQDGYYDIATLTVGKLSFDDWQGMYVGLVPKTTSMTGDVNADGQVDISDVNAVIDIMLGKAQPSTASDVTSDGQVDISDVNAIIDIMLGK